MHRGGYEYRGHAKSGQFCINKNQLNLVVNIERFVPDFSSWVSFTSLATIKNYDAVKLGVFCLDVYVQRFESGSGLRGEMLPIKS